MPNVRQANTTVPRESARDIEPSKGHVITNIFIRYDEVHLAGYFLYDRPIAAHAERRPWPARGPVRRSACSGPADGSADHPNRKTATADRRCSGPRSCRTWGWLRALSGGSTCPIIPPIRRGGHTARDWVAMKRGRKLRQPHMKKTLKAIAVDISRMLEPISARKNCWLIEANGASACSLLYFSPSRPTINCPIWDN